MTVDLWALILPWLILLARTGAFFLVLPIFGWQWLPTIVRAGIAVLVTAAYGAAGHVPSLGAEAGDLLAAGLLMGRETLLGLGLGLAASFLFLAVQQAGQLISQQMGLAEAGIIDPVTGEESEVMGMFLQVVFVVLFLAAGGHRVLVGLLWKSYEVFPVGGGPEMAAMAEVLVRAGSDMLVFMLQLAAPLLAAFLILTVALAALARAMPEVNVLYMSFPLRVGLGVFMAAAILPTFRGFTGQMLKWMEGLLAT